MLTKDKQIKVEDLMPGAFERELLPMPANWYVLAVYEVLSTNPDSLKALLSDRNTTLLFFMWLSYGAFASRKLPEQLKDMPDMLWKALVQHNWINIYASGEMDSFITKTFGMNLSMSGHTMYRTCGDFNNFSQMFKQNLNKMYRLLNSKNRTEFQEKVPVSDAAEMFNCNYDSNFSMNEYIPMLNRLNRHLDISSIMYRLFTRISVSASVREMLKDFEIQKDPSKFPILWERLAGHPDFGNLMLELSRAIKTWFDVHSLRNGYANGSSEYQK